MTLSRNELTWLLTYWLATNRIDTVVLTTEFFVEVEAFYFEERSNMAVSPVSHNIVVDYSPDRDKLSR